MSAFLREAVITPAEGCDLWTLVGPVIYRSDLLGTTVMVPAGFIYDGNSIPQWLRALPIVGYFLKDKIAYPGAAALHDYGYRYAVWPRATTDALYREALGVEGASAMRRAARFFGVRAGGWKAWRDHRKADHVEAAW